VNLRHVGFEVDGFHKSSGQWSVISG
jgi:hypothetical protein